MFTSGIRTNSPFHLPDLNWCEISFDYTDVYSSMHRDQDQGLVQVALPPRLINASIKRRSEFLAGRVCAAFALRQAGATEDVPASEDRSPDWPDGIAGSISHSGNRAIAVVSRHYKAIGVDCEGIMSRDLAEKLTSMIITNDEARLRPEILPFEVFLTLVFSAKEAFYKSISKTVDRILDFKDVELISVNDSDLRISFAGQSTSVFWLRNDSWCTTLVALPRELKQIKLI